MTVDLPAPVHRRVVEYATQSGQSLSATLAALVAKAVGSVTDDLAVTTNPATGFPTVSYGEPITAVEAARLIDEDA
jgi:hypothetical protein